MAAKINLKALIQESKDGEWGKDQSFEDAVEMTVIRGTDFDSVRVGETNALPVRFIPKRIADRKVLQADDIIFETAGGSKNRPTGRSVFLKSYLLQRSKLPITCAPGNWTFVIVTDRQELDGQIYKNFANCGVVTETEERIHAQSGEHLKELLREDHRFVFTLIQKFRTDKGATYPQLSDRSDIIVITDEAHRSQYDVFALNMRNALPNAAFIGFTGTPLMAGEELTRKALATTSVSTTSSSRWTTTLPCRSTTRTASPSCN
jgi:hypothetical protein